MASAHLDKHPGYPRNLLTSRNARNRCSSNRMRQSGLKLLFGSFLLMSQKANEMASAPSSMPLRIGRSNSEQVSAKTPSDLHKRVKKTIHPP